MHKCISWSWLLHSLLRQIQTVASLVHMRVHMCVTIFQLTNYSVNSYCLLTTLQQRILLAAQWESKIKLAADIYLAEQC